MPFEPDPRFALRMKRYFENETNSMPQQDASRTDRCVTFSEAEAGALKLTDPRLESKRDHIDHCFYCQRAIATCHNMLSSMPTTPFTDSVRGQILEWLQVHPLVESSAIAGEFDQGGQLNIHMTQLPSDGVYSIAVVAGELRLDIGTCEARDGELALTANLSGLHLTNIQLPREIFELNLI